MSYVSIAIAKILLRYAKLNVHLLKIGILVYLVTLKVSILSILWMAVNGNNIARREVKTQIKIREPSFKSKKKNYL